MNYQIGVIGRGTRDSQSLAVFLCSLCLQRTCILACSWPCANFVLEASFGETYSFLMLFEIVCYEVHCCFSLKLQSLSAV